MKQSSFTKNGSKYSFWDFLEEFSSFFAITFLIFSLLIWFKNYFLEKENKAFEEKLQFQQQLFSDYKKQKDICELKLDTIKKIIDFKNRKYEKVLNFKN